MTGCYGIYEIKPGTATSDIDKGAAISFLGYGESVQDKMVYGGAISYLSKGYAYSECSFAELERQGRDVIRTSNTNTTYDLNTNAFLSVPLFGNVEGSSGTGLTDFTINDSLNFAECNFTGLCGVTVHIYAADVAASNTYGANFAMRVYVGAVQGDAVEVSNQHGGAGVTARLPFLAIPVTTGDQISIKTMKNAIDGSLIIGPAGSCYITLEKL